jgi:cytochrome oxidase Cu insertion factor (SCO1/SenC/PrrC family)
MSTLLRRTLFTAFLTGTLLAAQAAHAAPVPDFTLPLLDGKSVALKDFRGKPVLINFFHSK